MIAMVDRVCFILHKHFITIFTKDHKINNNALQLLSIWTSLSFLAHEHFHSCKYLFISYKHEEIIIQTDGFRRVERDFSLSTKLSQFVSLFGYKKLYIKWYKLRIIDKTACFIH